MDNDSSTIKKYLIPGITLGGLIFNAPSSLDQIAENSFFWKKVISQETARLVEVIMKCGEKSQQDTYYFRGSFEYPVVTASSYYTEGTSVVEYDDFSTGSSSSSIWRV